MQYISKYIQIYEGKVYLDGELYFTGSTTDFKVFAKEVYHNLGLQYPKFYKMDNLCKLAFLASETILSNNKESEVAIIFANKESSLDSDIQHQSLIQNKDEFYPSPAVFVYTLANICIGEVSIRHGFKTESVFLLSENFQTGYIQPYAEYLIESNKAKKVLCGWLEMLEDHYCATIYLVEPKGELEHNESNINKLIKE